MSFCIFRSKKRNNIIDKLVLHGGILVFACMSVCSSQPSAIRFDHLTVDDGLPANYVSAIVQDRKGYMWFSTSNGLVKYDGYSFTTYSHDVFDSNSISGNQSVTFYQDRFGEFWISFLEGVLDRFDPNVVPPRFKHYRHDESDTLSYPKAQTPSKIIDDPTNPGLLWIWSFYDRFSFSRRGETFSHLRSEPA